jgi:hypothetical protein
MSGENEVDFQVNDATYFVTLADGEKRWEVFVSTPAGVRPVPVYEDAAELDSLFVIQGEKQRLPN